VAGEGKKGFASMRGTPNWLDGKGAGVRSMGDGSDTAQVTPGEYVEAASSRSGATVLLNTRVVGVELSELPDGEQAVAGVEIVTADGSRSVLEADAVCLSTGPWGCMAEDWFPTISSPMEGIKSTSVTFPARETANDAVALFCNEDSRFNTHLEVYVRAKRAPILTCNDAGPSEHPLLARAPTPNCLAATKQDRASIRCWRERPPRYVSQHLCDLAGRRGGSGGLPPTSRDSARFCHK
jgi:glycine/D-amino acid oxidase-like deaminating enzyme